jgi:hypothetical protein
VTPGFGARAVVRAWRAGLGSRFGTVWSTAATGPDMGQPLGHRISDRLDGG